MIKMVIFDLDGTLVDSLTDLALNVNKGLRAVGLPAHPVERYRTNSIGSRRYSTENTPSTVTTTLRPIRAAARCSTAWRRTAF